LGSVIDWLSDRDHVEDNRTPSPAGALGEQLAACNCAAELTRVQLAAKPTTAAAP
jgi:hypothetical protein